MATLPRQDRRSRTGTNLRGNPVRSHRLKRQQRAARALARLSRDYRRACRKAVSQRALERAARIAAEIQEERCVAGLKARGDEKKLAALKDRARRKFRRLLAQAVPGYRKWVALRAAYQRDYRKLAGSAAVTGIAGQAVEAWGSLAPAEPPPGALLFTPPYPLFDVQLIDPFGRVTQNDSFAVPSSGILVNHLTQHRDEDTAIIVGLYGLTTRPDVTTSLVACGRGYTMPRSGRLQVNAEFQNHLNKATLSLQDRFGFSYGNLTIRVQLFVDVLFGGQVTHMPTAVLTSTLSSDGEDDSRIITDIDNSRPHQIVATTPGSYAMGDRVLVMFGSEVTFESELDDMVSQATAAMYWQVPRVFVGVP